jgi:hypothetical protein
MIEVIPYMGGYIARLGNLSAFGPTPNSAIAGLRDKIEKVKTEENAAVSKKIASKEVTDAYQQMLTDLHAMSDSMFQAYEDDELTEEDVAWLGSQEPKDEESNTPPPTKEG